MLSPYLRKFDSLTLYTTHYNSDTMRAHFIAWLGTKGSGTVTSVSAGAGLTGGTWTTAGTVSMPNVGTAGTYGSATAIPVITTDAQGRVSALTTTTITPPPTYAAGTGISISALPTPAITNTSPFNLKLPYRIPNTL